MRLLITGGAGFIGSHLIDHIIAVTSWDIVSIDKLSYASKTWSRIQSLHNGRLKCITWDLDQPFSDNIKSDIGDINIIIHMAAETHVDRSIDDPVHTIRNNVMSTVYLLEFARTLKNLTKFQYFSTDEVFGPASNGINYKEWDRHNPTNPYSASKSAAESICLAYQNTYKIPLIITNLMNAYGTMQHSEKFIPLVIKKLLKGETITIHTDQNGVPGSRFYIHTTNIASAILFILNNVEIGSKINITGELEVDNLQLAQKIAIIMGKELKYELAYTSVSRPGHDIRYALDGSKLSDLGWFHQSNLDDLLKEVVKWSLEHNEWLED